MPYASGGAKKLNEATYEFGRLRCPVCGSSSPRLSCNSSGTVYQCTEPPEYFLWSISPMSQLLMPRFWLAVCIPERQRAKMSPRLFGNVAARLTPFPTKNESNSERKREKMDNKTFENHAKKQAPVPNSLRAGRVAQPSGPRSKGQTENPIHLRRNFELVVHPGIHANHSSGAETTD